MTNAEAIILINLAVAGMLCAFFLGTAFVARNRAARWFGAAYALGVVWSLAELATPHLDRAMFIFVGFALTIQAALLAIDIGIARRFGRPAPWALLGGVFAASAAAFAVAFHLPRDTLAYITVYQAPYAVASVIGVALIARQKDKGGIDLLLAAALALNALSFCMKPLIAQMTGGPGVTPQDYIATNYAVISQSLGTVVALATALTLVATIIGDTLREARLRSETDPLSGLLNRRGFETRLRQVADDNAHTGLPLSLVLCDLDHFKSINDRHGHAVGDQVIAHFAQVLREAVAGNHVVARIGGEEYAVVLSNAPLAVARMFAESVRETFARTPLPGLEPVEATVSMGVAERAANENLAGLMERADGALYAAKAAGRDCVRVAGVTLAAGEGPHRQAAARTA